MVAIKCARPKHRCWRAIRCLAFVRGRGLIHRTTVQCRFTQNNCAMHIHAFRNCFERSRRGYYSPLAVCSANVEYCLCADCFLVSSELDINTLRRLIKSQSWNHAYFLNGQLLGRWAIVASQIAVMHPARNNKYVRLNPSTRIAQPCGNPVNGQHHYSPQLLNLWARTLTQSAQFTERVHLKIVQRINVRITQLD